jgi:hypothetical protein
MLMLFENSLTAQLLAGMPDLTKSLTKPGDVNIRLAWKRQHMPARNAGATTDATERPVNHPLLQQCLIMVSPSNTVPAEEPLDCQ